jgi:predicted RND superfamily exporter protein
MTPAVHSLFGGIADTGLRYWKTITVAVILWVAVSPLLMQGFRLETSTASVSSPDDPVSQVYNRNMRLFGESSPLVIRLAFPETSLHTVNLFTEALAEGLGSWEEISCVEYRITAPNDPLLATAMLRAALLNGDGEVPPRFIARFTDAGLEKSLRRSRKRLIALEDPASREAVTNDVLDVYGLVVPFLESRLNSDGFSFDEGYFDSADGTSRLLYIYPEISAEDAYYSVAVISRVDAFVRDLQASIAGAAAIEVDLVGKYAVSGETMVALRRDMSLITTIAAGAIFLLLWLVFRNVRALIIAFTPIAVSLVTVFVLARMLFNPLNYLSLAFAAIILGIGVDVMLHCTGRFYQMIGASEDVKGAVLVTMRDCGPPVVIGLTTTAAAFLCLVFAEYQALRQFGLLTAAGLVLTLWICLCLFPVMVRLVGPRTAGAAGTGHLRSLPEGFFSFPLSRPRISIALAVIIFGGSLFFAGGFSFEMDLYSGIPREMESLRAGEDAAEAFGVSHFMGVQVTLQSGSTEEAFVAQEMVDRRLEKLVEEGMIAGFQSASQYVAYSGRRFPEQRMADNKKLFLELLGKLKFRPDPEYGRYYDLMTAVAEHDPALRDDWIRANGGHPVLGRFIASEGDELVLQSYIWPVRDLRDSSQVREITAGLQDLDLPDGVDLRITGTYQVFEHITSVVRSDFFRISVISGVMVVLCMLLFFRKLKLVLLCAAPVVIAVAVTLAAFALVGISFSPMSTGFIAIIVGIGIDDAVHILVRMRSRSRGELQVVLHEVGIILTLTTISTMIGFGAMMISSFYTMFSTGLVIALGVFFCLVFTIIVVPAGYVLLHRRTP